MRTVCVFCGSSAGHSPAWTVTARKLGTALAERGLAVVYGGAHVGTMGALAGGALEAGGEVIGVMPQRLVDREVAHTSLTRLEVVATMHERKARMAELADAFIALPGGFGTLDELFEILTWAQIGLHAKPIGLLDVGGFFGPLLSYLDHAVAQGFIQPRHRALLHVATDAPALLSTLEAHEQDPATAPKFALRGDL